MTTRRVSSLFVALVVVLAACGEPVREADAPKQAAPRAPAKVDPTAASADDAYYYNPAGKRDPFQSFIKRGQTDEFRPDAPPLQRWDVDKYTLRGVIWSTQAPRALLVDPEGTGHVIKLGTYVGRNWGKVTSISEACVVVTEEYQTLDGELVVNPVTVCF
ncbi:MAG: pilus assembly protein PilP, partial [bacterium]